MSAAVSIDDAIRAHGKAAVRDAARRACWRAGDLSYHCSAVQLELRALVAKGVRRAAAETNRRFGKTRTCVVISGEWCLAFPGVRIPYAAPTATQVRTFVHPHMLELTQHAPPDIAPELNGGAWVFPPLQWYDAAGNPVRTKAEGGVELARFKGTAAEEALRMSRVSPHGCEDRKKADALRGTGTVGAIVDEARDIPILGYVLRSVLGPMLWEARSRWHESVDPVLLVASTPADDMEHPFPQIADQARAKGAYFHATVYDCDHLSERDIADAIEEAGGEDTVAWQVEGLAQRVRDPERVVLPEFGADCIGEAERPEWFLPCIIGDLGFTDMSVIAFGFYDFEADRYVIEDEVAGQRMTSDVLDAAIEETTRRLWGSKAVHRRRIDGTARERADLSRAEWQDQGNGADATWTAVSRDGGDGKGRMRALANRARVLCKRGQILVHPRCETIIAHAQGAKWDRARKSFLRVTDEDEEPLHHYDGAAALLYFLRDCDATTNPAPALPPGVTDETHHIPWALKRDEKRERLGRLLGGRR